MNAVVLGTSCTAIDFAPCFNAVANDAAAAMTALGSQCMDGAFERIEDVLPSTTDYRETLVVIVSANFAFHDCFSRAFDRMMKSN